MVGITPAAGTCTRIHTFPTFLIYSSHSNLSYTLGLFLLHSERKHQLAVISHDWNIFALTLVRDANSPVLSEGPLAYIPRISSQRAQRRRTRGQRRVVKYFSSQKRWMRAGVLGDVFPISLRQSGFLSQTYSGKCIFSVYLPTSMLCQLSKWPQASVR